MSDVKENDDFYIKEIFKTLWFYKLWLLLGVVVSILLSMVYLKNTDPIYKVETVIELPGNEDQVRSPYSVMGEAMSSMSFLNLGGGLGETDDSGLIQKFLGKKFLTSLLTDPSISTDINRICSVDVSGSLPRRILERLSVVDKINATPEQITDAKVQCIKQLLDIREFRYGELKTPAFTISMEHEDPFFSAKMLNRSVDLFFQSEKEETLKEHKKTSLHLSDLLAKSEVRKNVAERKLEQAILENTSSAMGERTNFTARSMANLVALRERKEALEENIDFLKELKSINLLEKKATLDLINVKKDLSPSFYDKADKILQGDKEADTVKNELESLIEEENRRLILALKSLEIKKNEVQDEVKKIVSGNKEIELLELEFVSAKTYFEGLKQIIVEKDFGHSLGSIVEGIIHTRAAPPLTPKGPKIKQVFIINFIISLFIAATVILVIQASRGIIIGLEQLRGEFYRYPSILIRNKKELNISSLMAPDAEKKARELSFLGNIEEFGKIGLLIELGTRQSTGTIKERVGLFLSKCIKHKNDSFVLIGGNAEINGYFPNSNTVANSSLTSNSGKENSQNISFISRAEIYPEAENLIKIFNNARKMKGGLFLINYKEDSALISEIAKSVDYIVMSFKVGKVKTGDLKAVLNFLNPETKKMRGFLVIK